MAGRRRTAAAELRLGSAIKAAGACLLIGAASVIYVRQQHELSTLMALHRQLEKQVHLLRLQNHQFELRKAQLNTPAQIKAAAESLEAELQLRPAEPGQVVVVRVHPFGAVPSLAGGPREGRP